MGWGRVGAAIIVVALVGGCASSAEPAGSSPSSKSSRSAGQASPGATRSGPSGQAVTGSAETWGSDDLYESCLAEASDDFGDEQAPLLCECYVHVVEHGASPASPTAGNAASQAAGISHIAGMCPSESPSPSESPLVLGSDGDVSPTANTPTPNPTRSPTGYVKPTCTSRQVASWTSAQRALSTATENMAALTRELSDLRAQHQAALGAGNESDAGRIQGTISARSESLAIERSAAATAKASMSAIDQKCRRP